MPETGLRSTPLNKPIPPDASRDGRGYGHGEQVVRRVEVLRKALGETRPVGAGREVTEGAADGGRPGWADGLAAGIAVRREGAGETPGSLRGFL